MALPRGAMGSGLQCVIVVFPDHTHLHSDLDLYSFDYFMECICAIANHV